MYWCFLLLGCFSTRQKDVEKSGGEATVYDASIHAYSLATRQLSTKEKRKFAVGNAFFNDNWVTAPASATGRDGLGPLFNARSCSSCHFKDGRGKPPDDDQNLLSMLLRISIPGIGENGEPLGDPNYGTQLQTNAIDLAPSEAAVKIIWQYIDGSYPDGTQYQLRKPTYQLSNLAYGSISPHLQISGRVAPGVFGGGLLEAIADQTIIDWADPEDKNQDGISGKPNWVYDDKNKTRGLGRFGWKAISVSLEQQISGAFVGDIGITTSIHRQHDLTNTQQQQLATIPDGGKPEINDHKLQRIVFYNQTLAVPARRNWTDPKVKQGEKLFSKIGCSKCHIPNVVTGNNHELSYLNNQTIRPYTDLLLHDMGEGLADHRAVFEATGREWKTPPLWGIGLIETVNGHGFLLHDGRARNLEEAILWHDGEAKSAKQKFMHLSQKKRDYLIDFLRDL